VRLGTISNGFSQGPLSSPLSALAWEVYVQHAVCSTPFPVGDFEVRIQPVKSQPSLHMTAIHCEKHAANMQLPHEDRTHSCGVLMETRGANQQGAEQASSHLWLGCLTFAWDDGLAWFAHDGAGISP
jgi:hypothetical protein